MSDLLLTISFDFGFSGSEHPENEIATIIKINNLQYLEILIIAVALMEYNDSAFYQKLSKKASS